MSDYKPGDRVYWQDRAATFIERSYSGNALVIEFDDDKTSILVHASELRPIHEPNVENPTPEQYDAAKAQAIIDAYNDDSRKVTEAEFGDVVGSILKFALDASTGWPAANRLAMQVPKLRDALEDISGKKQGHVWCSCSTAVRTARAALAALADVPEAQSEKQSGRDDGDGHCEVCGYELDEASWHECPPGFQDVPQDAPEPPSAADLFQAELEADLGFDHKGDPVGEPVVWFSANELESSKEFSDPCLRERSEFLAMWLNRAFNKGLSMKRQILIERDATIREQVERIKSLEERCKRQQKHMATDYKEREHRRDTVTELAIVNRTQAERIAELEAELATIKTETE